MKTTNLALAFLFGTSLALGGCGGGDSETTIKSSNTTMGQELMDLDKSYKAGIISEKQYESAKKDILKKYE